MASDQQGGGTQPNGLQHEQSLENHTPYLTPTDSMPSPLPVVSLEPAPLPLETAADLLEAYDCAKLNNNWTKVTSSVMVHLDWLTKIPEGRRWAILHQVVYSGNVMHLNEVLALQLANPAFRLLSKTAEGKTVREVAQERAHINPNMMRTIERLVAVDQLLNNAKDGKWAQCRQLIRTQPDIVNEKPPYRQFYLAHHLAYMGALDTFLDFSSICQFKLTLIADNKTINQVARETNHIEFAEAVERICPDLIALREQQIAAAAAASNAGQNPVIDPITSGPPYPPRPQHTQHYSQGFYDDPGIMIFSLQSNNSNNDVSSHNESPFTPYPPHPHPHNSYHDQHFITHSLLLQNSNATMPNHPDEPNSSPSITSHQPQQQPEKETPAVSHMSEEDQAAYEKTVHENIKQMSQQNLINCITCCISKAILRDPVVAADGFTYEREEILKWFEHSARSPMTNQELENQELKPNYAIKQILLTLSEANKQEPTKKEGADYK